MKYSGTLEMKDSGQIKACLGFHKFLLRGLEQMQGEWKLVCLLVHNLLKLFRSGALVPG